MRTTLEQYELIRILKGVAELCAEKVLMQTGQLKPYLTQTEAYKMYGRKTVEKWIKEKKITAYKSGDNNSKVLLERMELSLLVKSSELIVHFKEAA